MFRGPRMNSLKFTLLTDGSSDQVLIRHLEWLVHRHLPQTTTVQSEWADLRTLREKPIGLAERIQRAIELYPCDVLFVHRDAEKQDPQLRYDEIAAAVRSIPVFAESLVWVCVVPVRMQEAWLLFDESAIRRGRGEPERPTGSRPAGSRQARESGRSKVVSAARAPHGKRAIQSTAQTSSKSSGSSEDSRLHRRLLAAASARRVWQARLRYPSGVPAQRMGGWMM